MEEGAQVTCPACGAGNLSINTEESNIPHFGIIVISTLQCSSCGYRSTDVLPVEEKPPARFRFRIRKKEDLSVRVIRSSTSTLTIPDLGITIQPGSAHEGYITNIEGVIIRILGIMDQIERDLIERSDDLQDAAQRLERTRSLKDRLNMVLQGDIESKGSFEMVIVDPQGNSALVDDDDRVLKEEMTEKEILELTSALYS
jgi:zinc finger protein